MNHRIGNLAASLFAVAALFASGTAFANNIVLNGDFAAGTTNWSINDNVYGYPQWGSFYFNGIGNIASTHCYGVECITGTGSALSTLSQDLATVAGDTYTLSFEYSPDVGNNGNTGNELKVLFGGTVANDLVALSNDAFVTYTVSGLVADSSSKTLEFLGRGDGLFIALTNLSVVDNGPAPVPEPSTFGFLMTGLVGLSGLLRRKIRA